MVKEITETLVRVAGAKPENVCAIITDHSKGNLARSGKLLSDKTEALSGRVEVSESEGDIVFDKREFGK